MAPPQPPPELAPQILSRALACSATAIFITDAGGRIVWVNAAFSLLTGYAAGEAVGATPALLKSGRQSDAFYAELWQTILAGEVWRGTMTDRRKDASLFTVDEVITPLLDESGNITHFIAIQHDMTLRKKIDDENAYLARHDALTGLANRALFLTLERHALARARDSGQPLALLFIDIDGFKPVNDTYGHGVGDQLLVAIGKRLRAAVKKTDITARFGGDEFLILLTGLPDTGVPAALARKLLDLLAQPFMLAGRRIEVRASIGIAVYPEHGSDGASLLAHADRAMYCAKKMGGNHYRSYIPALGHCGDPPD